MVIHRTAKKNYAGRYLILIKGKSSGHKLKRKSEPNFNFSIESGLTWQNENIPLTLRV